MNKSRLKKSRLSCCAIVLLGGMTLNAQAASIWLAPVSNVDINIGETAVYQVWADASDVGGILAGGLDLFYDSTILTYDNSFAFDGAFPIDPAFSRTGDNCFSNPATIGCASPGEINGIAFGNFNGLAAGGPTLMGTLSFTGLAEGISPLTMADNELPAGSWFATDGSGPLIIDYGSGQVTVAPVPIPAAVWLFGSGLLGLVSIARRKKAA